MTCHASHASRYKVFLHHCHTYLASFQLSSLIWITLQNLALRRLAEKVCVRLIDGISYAYFHSLPQLTRAKGPSNKTTSGVAVKSNKSRSGGRSARKTYPRGGTSSHPLAPTQTKKVARIGILPYVNLHIVCKILLDLIAPHYSWPMR